MKLKEFISDSMSLGKGSVRYPIGMFVKQYRDNYNKLKKREDRKFTYTIYSIFPGERHMIHVKVPSETVRDFYYDVAFEYTPDKDAKSFEDCDVKIFSNCPSFVYTSAYIFAHWNPDLGKVSSTGRGMMIDAFKKKLPRERMLIPGLETKLGDEPIHDKPEIRNPLGAPLFDKSLYYATFYILENVPYDELIAKLPATPAIKVYDTIQDFDQLMTARDIAAKKQKEDHEKAQQDLAEAFHKREKKVTSTRAQRGVMTPMSTRKPNTARSTSKVSGMKSPKRIG